MRLTIFSLVFMLLIAGASLAEGLEITEIDVHVDYDEAYTYRVENKDRIDFASVPVANNSKIDADILPGSNVTFTVRVENTFQNEDRDLRGVFVTITIEDIDDGADLDEESLDFDLEPGDDYRVDVKFNVPLDVEAGTYNVVVEADAEDRNETSYSTKVNLKLEVKKQSHDIRITRVLLNPSIVDCDRKAKLTAEITNVGSNAENQVALEFKSDSLGVNSIDRDIFLESSDEASEEEKIHTKTLTIIVPSILKSATYPISVNLYWKNIVLFDQKIVDLIVRECGSGATTTELKPEPKNETGVVTPVKSKDEIKEQIPEEGKPSIRDVITATREISILNFPLMLLTFSSAFVILTLAILAILGYFFRNKIQ